MESKKRLVLGIVRETSTAWERRAPFTPKDVSKMITEKGIEVHIQPSKVRCFSDMEYERAGAKIREELSEC